MIHRDTETAWAGGTIDVNCDMGEGFGAYRIGQDEELVRYISSANIACGFHAGDPSTMRKTVRLCLTHGVAIGAHPGLPDLQGFGRREIAVTAEQAYEMVLAQLGALYAFVRVEGGLLHHVKPHGALYNMAAKKRELAEAIVKAVYDFDKSLVLYGLAGSELVQCGRTAGLTTASEGFADRSYEPDGSLTPRNLPNAVHESADAALEQAVRMAKQGTVKSRHGEEIVVLAETICLHGDHPHAAVFARSLFERLQAEDIRISAPLGSGR